MFSKSFYKVLICIGALFVGFLFFLYLPKMQGYVQSLRNQQLEREEDLEDFLADQEIERTPCIATPAAGMFSDAVVPAGKTLYTNEEVGFRFMYPSALFVDETIETEDWSTGTCVYTSWVHIQGRGWELSLSATRGGFATGREGFNETRTIPLITRDGHEFSLSVDDVCEYSEHGDCGYSASFEKDGISFLIYSSQLAWPDGVNALPFKEVPEIAEILSSLETVKGFNDSYQPATLIGFENAPKVIVDFVHEVLKADLQEGRIGPDGHIDSVELIRVHEVTWNTSCLTFVNAYPDRCIDGVYPGYQFAVLIDGNDEFQVWHTTADGVHQDISGGYSKSEIDSELATW